MNGIKATFCVVILLLSPNALSNAPDWLNKHSHPSYRYTQSACALISSDPYTAKLIAETKAKGALAQSFGGHVTATSTLTKNDKELDGSNVSSEQLTERIEIRSSRKLSALTTISQGKYTIDNKEHFCIWLGSNS